MYFYEENSFSNRYTFDNFVINNEDNKVYIAIKNILDNFDKKTSFNPLFIVGESGTGKTHILNAIAFELRKKLGKVKFLYTTIDMLSKDYSESLNKDRIESLNNNSKSLRNKEIDKLKEVYNNLDFLLIDDFDQILSKKETQKIFFSIFNNLYSNGKKIIIASKMSIMEMEKFNNNIKNDDYSKHIDDRILSRIMCGLSLDMEHYGYDMIISILRKKSENINLSQEILDYIVTNVNTTNISKIEFIIPQLILYTVNTKKKISLEIVKNIIIKMNINKTNFDQISINSIIKATAKFFSINESKILGSSRRKEISLARHIAMYLSIKHTTLGQKSIGEYFGGRNHSSVIYARNNIEKKLKTDENYNYYVNNIISSLKNNE